MKVEDVFLIKGRGLVFTTHMDNKPLLYNGQLIFRVSDGHIWEVAGVEHWAIEKKDWTGQPIGVLIKYDETRPEAGDEIERY
jgi:hypothetical protein